MYVAFGFLFESVVSLFKVEQNKTCARELFRAVPRLAFFEMSRVSLALISHDLIIHFLRIRLDPLASRET